MDPWYDMEMSMIQPGHATIYITGKNELERVMADRAMQLGDDFNLRQFMDEFCLRYDPHIFDPVEDDRT